MQDARPSRTAMRVAMRRAAHQLFDNPPRVLDDPLATKIIGGEAVSRLQMAPAAERGRVARSLRAFMAARSRYAEDELARSVRRGAAQYVILGAGLDTFPYRNPYGDALRVFEVDYPATQAWKRDRLAAAAIHIPASLTFAPVDFEHQTLAEGLERAGFNRLAPACFSWLGVTMYLTDEAIASTFNYVASTPPGGGLVFDYAVPRASLGWMGRLALDAISRRVAKAGEPFRSFFDPAALRDRLLQIGFRSVEDLGSDELNERYFKGRADGLRIGGNLGRLASAEI